MKYQRILLVDDESVVRMTTALILKKIGCIVTAFDNGTDARNFYENSHTEIDLAIIDSHMPEMSGTELFKELQLINPNVLAILASGFLSDEEMERSSLDGFTAVINKPFHMNELKELMESL